MTLIEKIRRFKGIALNPKMRNTLKIVFGCGFVVFFLFSGFAVFLSVQSRATGKVPSIGNFQIYSVVGGSMEPNIHKGSVVITRRPKVEDLKVGDVITFISPGDKKTVVTHRIAKISNTGGEITFTTRGDANDREDIEPLPANYILGQVRLTIPLVGNLMNFSRSKAGLIVLIIIPGVLIILIEALSLKKTLFQLKKQKEAALIAKLKESLNQTSAEGGNSGM